VTPRIDPNSDSSISEFAFHVNYDPATVQFLSAEYGTWLYDPNLPVFVHDPIANITEPGNIHAPVVHFSPVAGQSPIVSSGGFINNESIWIPEPSSALLCLSGLVAVCLRYRRAAKHKSGSPHP
jgi:hypothetical protein